MADFLPYGRHSIEDDDIAAVTEVLKNQLLTCGNKVPELEAALSDYFAGSEVVICSNGTSALHLAALSSGLREGNCAIVPAMTFAATANAVRMTGADVVFADVDPENGLITEETLKTAIEKSKWPIRAIMPVQLTGQSPNMQAIGQIATDIDATVISDACHALGAEKAQGSSKIGSGLEEDYACFSFHPVKAIAMGEGGAIVTKNKEKAAKMRLLRTHDMQRVQNAERPWAYEMHDLGYNYRATDVQAALGLSQFKKLDRFIEKRRVLASHYNDLLKPLSPYIIPIKQTGYAVSAWHLYSVLIDFEKVGLDRAGFMKALARQGVGSQVHYIPVSEQPYYQKLYGKQDLPGTKSYYDRTLTLPLYPAMDIADVERVVSTIQKIVS